MKLGIAWLLILVAGITAFWIMWGYEKNNNLNERALNKFNDLCKSGVFPRPVDSEEWSMLSASISSADGASANVRLEGQQHLGPYSSKFGTILRVVRIKVGFGSLGVTEIDNLEYVGQRFFPSFLDDNVQITSCYGLLKSPISEFINQY